ncbi:M20 family metallopeptidase [Paenibacillus senegalensis]|uniref:M20 family metallopeptidase n=1 Tax=Paenibacillus senegalensis TaxID=1465766 RepID=UPI000288DCC1|nr:M20 family metallopeptidase [Paenibacillus senegalensis]
MNPLIKEDVIELLESMIAIPSVNPAYDPGSGGEQLLSEYIEQRCKARGLSVERQPVLPGRDNLIIRLNSGHPERTLLFEAHMDTVSFGGMSEPLLPRRINGRLYGRGACDTKGSLAAMLQMMEHYARNAEGLNADLILCASVDEEHAYRGLLQFMELGLPIHGAVVGEPTNLGIVIAHKGCVRFEIETIGKAAHSSVPHEGRSAIMDMVKVLHYLEQSKSCLENKIHPLCGAPSLTVGTIRGGQEINIVPDSCTIKVDRRLIPGEQPAEIMQELQNNLQEYLGGLGIEYAVRELLLDEALDTSPASTIVRSAQKAASQLQISTKLCGAAYGSDASKLQQRQGIPTIVFGPGSIQQAHSDEEWVSMEEVRHAARFYIELVQKFSSADKEEFHA